jgi:cytochrome c-type biogenesis protein CcmE
MNIRKKRRLVRITAIGSALAMVVGLVLFALSDQIVFFITPSDVMASQPASSQRFRLGGLVKEGTISKQQGGILEFVVTDGIKDMRVSYQGIVPDLFREGQGVVTEGYLTPDGHFKADTLLAKHDENYMPPEVAKALKEKGFWQGQPTEPQ